MTVDVMGTEYDLRKLTIKKEISRRKNRKNKIKITLFMKIYCGRMLVK